MTYRYFQHFHISPAVFVFFRLSYTISFLPPSFHSIHPIILMNQFPRIKFSQKQLGILYIV